MFGGARVTARYDISIVPLSIEDIPPALSHHALSVVWSRGDESCVTAPSSSSPAAAAASASAPASSASAAPASAAVVPFGREVMRMREAFTFRRSGGAGASSLVPAPREHTLKAVAVTGGAAGGLGVALGALVGSAGPGRRTLARGRVDLARQLFLLAPGGPSSSSPLSEPPRRVEREAVFRLPICGGAQAAAGGGGALSLRVLLLAELVVAPKKGSAAPSATAFVLPPATATAATAAASFGAAASGGGSPSAPSSPSFAGEGRRRRPSGGGNDNYYYYNSGEGGLARDDDDDARATAGWRPAAAEEAVQPQQRRRRPLSCPSGEAVEGLCAAAARQAHEQEQQQQQQASPSLLTSWARTRPEALVAASAPPPSLPELRVCSVSPGTTPRAPAAAAQSSTRLRWPFGGGSNGGDSDRSPADDILRELLRLSGRPATAGAALTQLQQLLHALAAALRSERAAGARRAEDAERRAEAALASKRLIAERLAQVEGQVEGLLDEGGAGGLVDALVEAKTRHAQAAADAEALAGELRAERRRAGELAAALAQLRAESAAGGGAAAPAPAPRGVSAPAFVG